MDFGLGARPLAAVERLDGELEEELVGRCAALVGGRFDALPLLWGDADVLLEGLNHGYSSRVWAVSGRESVWNGAGIVAQSKIPDWYQS